jgi:hypothetical protein
MNALYSSLECNTSTIAQRFNRINTNSKNTQDSIQSVEHVPSPIMSLHFIGIRDFPVLHRQLTSPTAGMADSPVSVQDLAQDSKDVLVQRLNDLALRLTTEENLRDEDVTELHNEVDRMERAIQTSAWSHQNGNSVAGKSGGSIGSPWTQEEDSFWSPFSPSRKVNMRLPDTPLMASHSNLQKALEISPKKIVLIAQEAESLCQNLRGTVQELQARKEEIDVRYFGILANNFYEADAFQHIHDLLVTRAEKAAQRIIDLESQVKDLSVLCFSLSLSSANPSLQRRRV